MAFGGRREWWSLEAVAPAVLLATNPQDLEYVSQIKRVLELLKKNRDMLFNEVKLIIVIEDPRDVERKRLLGIDDETAPTRDDLADALVQVNEGQIPENRLALQMLAEELLQWPYLEDDESLRRWKEKLLGSVDINSAGETLDPEVKIVGLAIKSPGRSDINLSIPSDGKPKGTRWGFENRLSTGLAVGLVVHGWEQRRGTVLPSRLLRQ
ncbi:hypothetical protein CASFOL_033993 [Castilleja foliolosa]|uniref:Uncharacterized protein n=1 Tax=Castilleja foliolosa TaxID=1961234 RepID=A0ABD3BZ80_9LAMI